MGFALRSFAPEEYKSLSSELGRSAGKRVWKICWKGNNAVMTAHLETRMRRI
jgi:hypothetical protein